MNGQQVIIAPTSAMNDAIRWGVEFEPSARKGPLGDKVKTKAEQAIHDLI
jgi:hypothetical protein